MNKKKFTAIDAVIILVIIAAVVFGVMKLGLVEVEKAEETVVQYDVLISECEDNVIDAITVGDEVSISNKEKDTATVKNVRTETSRTMTYNSEVGEYYMKTLESKKDLYVTLEAKATQTDTLIQAGTTPIKVGLGTPVRGKGYALNGYIVNIDIAEQEK